MKRLLSNYKEFLTDEEASAWARNAYSYQCSDEFKKSKDFYDLFLYGGNMYKPINRFLRFGMDISVETKAMAERLKSIVFSATLPENVVVYRSTQYSAMKRLCGYTKIKPSMCFYDSAFLSTSLLCDCAMNFHKKHKNNCMLKMYLKAGIHAIYLSYENTSSVLHEQELLLSPELKFEVISVKGLFQKTIECKTV